MRVIFYLLLIAAMLAPAASAACPDPWSNGYSHQITITIDSSMVSGASNLSNFPIAAPITAQTWLKTLVNGGYVAESDGADILVESETDGVTLPYELVNYDGSAGTAQLYFKPATTYYAADTIVCLYVGKSGATSEADPSAVWSDYAAVYHMEEDLSAGGSDLYNSATETADATCGNFESGDTAAGAIGNAVTSNDTNEYCVVDDENFAESVTDGTISVISKILTGSDYWVAIMGDTDGSVDGLRFWNADVDDIFANYGTVWNPSWATAGVNFDTWSSYATRWKGSTNALQVVIDGVQEASVSTAPASGWTNTTSWYIFTTAIDLNARRWNNMPLDEIRFAWSYLSDAWLATESANLLSPGTYIAYGTPVAGASGASPPPRRALVTF